MESHKQSHTSNEPSCFPTSEESKRHRLSPEKQLQKQDIGRAMHRVMHQAECGFAEAQSRQHSICLPIRKRSYDAQTTLDPYLDDGRSPKRRKISNEPASHERRDYLLELLECQTTLQRAMLESTQRQEAHQRYLETHVSTWLVEIWTSLEHLSCALNDKLRD